MSGFGSGVCELAVAAFMNVVPTAVSADAFIVKVNVALVLAGSVAIVQVMVPPDPTGGSVHINAGPLSWLLDTKVIPVGTSSVSDTVKALSGPRFVRTTLNATLLPGTTEAGPLLVTERSAPANVVGCINSVWTACDTRGTTIRNRAVPRIAASNRILTDINEILPIGY